MDIVWVISFAVVFIGIIAAVGAVSARMQKLRREAMEKFALDAGLNFSAEDTEQFRTRLITFQLFKEGRAQRVYNLLRAEAEGVQMSVFDYQFTTGSGKHQSTHRQSILAVESKSLYMPSMTLRPESFFDAIAGVLGFRDIDFEDSPEFSRSFVVKSQFEELTRKLFDADVIQFFMERRDVAFEASANRFIYYRRNKTVQPQDLKAFLADGLQLYNLFSARLARLEQSEKAEGRLSQEQKS